MKIITLIDQMLRPKREHQNDEPFTFDVNQPHAFLMEGNKNGSKTKEGFEAIWSPKFKTFKVVLIGHVSVKDGLKIHTQTPKDSRQFKRRFCYMTDDQLVNFVRYNFVNHLQEFDNLVVEY